MLAIMRPASSGGEGGISIDQKSRQRRVWDLEARFYRERGYYPVPPERSSFLLSMVTPLMLGNDGTQKGYYATAFFMLLTRLQGLASWHGLRVTELGSLEEINRLSTAIKVVTPVPPTIASFSRRSRNFGPMVRHEDGLMLSLHVKDYPSVLWPAFVLGTLCHLGFSVSQGAGRYVISDP